MDINIILMIVIFLLIVVVVYLLKKSHAQADETAQKEMLRRMELLEERLGAALKNIRGEQSALAQASRLERTEHSDRLSEQIDRRVARLADITDKNLERIRQTVDERLNESLEQKFDQVSKRLAEVHAGLGQMQGLSTGVDDLKRILANVKVRGIWGEMQLGNILQDMLDKSRYAENVLIRPNSAMRVEYALRLPGAGESEVLLPIDAKFPVEDYQRLQQAREEGDTTAANTALKQLERRLRAEAKSINEKYIHPPYSTDFAIMYLPSEGLFVEALNLPGFVEELQLKYRVSVAGPTTLAALVNSLQMGFRTLAVQERTTEVWQLLNLVKQDLGELASSLEKSNKKLEEAQGALQATTRFVNRLSKNLDEVPRTL